MYTKSKPHEEKIKNAHDLGKVQQLKHNVLLAKFSTITSTACTLF